MVKRDPRARARTVWPLVLHYAGSSGSLALASVSQLFTFAIIAHAMGPSTFGLYVEISAVNAVAVQVCGLGASDCLIRRVSQRTDSYPALLGHNLILIGASGAVLVVLGSLVLSRWVYVATDPAVNIALIALLMTSNVVLVRLNLLVEVIFLGLGKFNAANRAVIGFAFARATTAALASLASASTVAEWAVWLFAGNLAFSVLGFWWLRPLGKPRCALVREELLPGLHYCSQFGARAVRQNVDLFTLSLFAPPDLIGSYGVARRIIDSSYLPIDAMNRLIYPVIARESLTSMKSALVVALRALPVAVALGCATAAALFIAAPLLPFLFGHEYGSMLFFVRSLAGLTILVSVASIALDLLGATNHQGRRAMIVNAPNLIGSLVIVGATWAAPGIGTIFALYAIEIAMTIAAWIAVLSLVSHEAASRVARL